MLGARGKEIGTLGGLSLNPCRIERSTLFSRLRDKIGGFIGCFALVLFNTSPKLVSSLERADPSRSVNRQRLRLVEIEIDGELFSNLDMAWAVACSRKDCILMKLFAPREKCRPR